MPEGRSIGTVFVELDLDPSRYTKGQQQLLRDATQTSINIEDNFKKMGIKSSAAFDLMRESIKNNYNAIKNNALATSNDIMRAEEAKHAKLTALNEQQFGKQTTMLEGLKSNYIAASAAIVGAWMAVNKAIGFMDDAGKALQAESAFKIMADSANVNADSMIAAMKRATKETIDDSDLMQKSVKLMTLGFDPAQIERFSNVVITASQIAGTTAAQAFDELGDAIGNRTPKAMIRMGAITREQMEVVTKAISAGASESVLFELAMANLEAKQKMLQGTQNEATISLQKFHTTVKETTETIGKGLIIAVDAAYRSFQYLTAGVLGLISSYRSYRALIYDIMGDEKKAADNREIANTFWIARNDLVEKAGRAIYQEGEASAKASKTEIEGAKAVVKAQMDKLRAIAGAKDESANAKKVSADQAKADEYYVRQVLAGISEMEKAGTEFSQWKMKALEDEGKKEAESVSLSVKQQIAGMDEIEKARLEFSQWKMKILEEEIKKEAEGVTLSVTQQIKGMDEIEKARLEFSQWQHAQIAKDSEAAAAKSEKAWRESIYNVRGITEDAFSSMRNSISTSIRGVIMGTQTMEDAFKRMGESIALGLIDSIVNRGLKQVENALLDFLFSGSGGGGGSGGGSGSGIGSTASTVWDWVKTAWNWLGSFDSGMWEVPKGKSSGSGAPSGGSWGSTRKRGGGVGGGGSAWIHPGEMVVPADIAKKLRTAVEAGGGDGFGGLSGLAGAAMNAGTVGTLGGVESTRGPQSYGEALSDAIAAGISGRLDTAGYVGMGVANIAGSLAFGAMSPSPIGALTGALGLAKRNTAVNSWGLQQLGWGLDPDIADMVAAEMSKQETATAIGHAAKSGLFGSLTDTISRAIGEFGDLAGSSNPSVGNFGGYSRGDPGYGDAPGMGGAGDGSGGGGGRTGDSNDPGGPGADDGSGMSLASGGLFRTKGRTRMTVGEAGAETVAVLRNPREVMAGAGVGGGGKVTINLYNSGVIGDRFPDALMREIRRELDRRDARLVKY